MASDIAFVVRTLSTPANGLKGAFRLHLTPEALTRLELKTGDICTIIAEDGTRGTAIAWRASDGMGKAPKVQPAKMSEVLRDTFGFKQGTQVRIEAATTRIHPATRIFLTEITPAGTDISDDDDRKLSCSAALFGNEAFAVGTSFDVRAGEGVKRRYYIERLEAGSGQDSSVLARINDRTEIQFLDVPLQSPTTTSGAQRPLQIDASRIGGLVDEIKDLNLRLRSLCDDARSVHRPVDMPYSQSALIYGYEGTGKTMLLNALEKVHGLSKVVRIDADQLLNTPSKNEAVINTAFKDATTAQPSLVLIDDIHRVASAADAAVQLNVSALARALDRITAENARVLVVATAASPTDVHKRLLKPTSLGTTIELPIPDAGGRTQILLSLLANEESAAQLAIELAGRTHGYTGRDLQQLVRTARFAARARLDVVDDDYVSITPPSGGSNRPVTSDSSNERNASVASTLVEHAAPNRSLLTADFDQALSEVRPSALREIIVEPPKVSFDDIGGSGALRARFEQIINWPVLHRDKFANLGDKKPKRGILLYGPPGCSKTMTAQAVASTYGWNFLAVKGAELVSMYVGESERAVREIFRKARQAAPTIIFFDEIDSIATARTSSSDASKSLNVVTTLLTEMDGFENTKHVLVLAATNKPESLDPAILRAGRFDEHIYLGPPSEDARREILRTCVRNVSGHIDVPGLARQSDGMSGAEIKNAWNAATDIALERAVIEEQAVDVTTEDFEKGIASTAKVITQDMLRAYEMFARRS